MAVVAREGADYGILERGFAGCGLEGMPILEVGVDVGVVGWGWQEKALLFMGCLRCCEGRLPFLELL